MIIDISVFLEEKGLSGVILLIGMAIITQQHVRKSYRR